MTQGDQRPGGGGRIARAAGQVAVLTALGRIVGFARWLVFAATVGAAGVGTVYQSVNTVPNVVYEIAAGGVLAAVVVPLLAGRVRGVAAAGSEDADDVAGALLTRTLTLLLPLAVLLALTAPWISEALLGDLGSPAVELGTRLLVLFSPQVPLYGLGIVVTGVLQAHERFVAAAAAPLLSSLVVIATYLLYGLLVPPSTPPADLSTSGWMVLGGGTTLGVVALSLPLLIAAGRAGIRLRPRWRLPAELTSRAARLAGAGIVGLLGQQIAVLVTLKVANRSGGDGTVVVHQYVQALYLLPYAVLAVPVATAAYPVIARVRERPEPAVRAVAGSLRTVVLLSAAAAAALIVVADPVGTVFAAIDRGDGDVALRAMPAGLAATAPGLVGFALAAVATRTLYARGSALAGGAAVALGWLVAATGPVLLLGPQDGPGSTLQVIGWSATLGMTLTAVLLTVLVRRGWGPGRGQGAPATAETASADGPREHRGPGVLAGLVPAAALAVVAVALAQALRVALIDRWPETTGAALVAGAAVAVLVAAAVALVAAAIDPAVRAALTRVVPVRTRGPR